MAAFAHAYPRCERVGGEFDAKKQSCSCHGNPMNAAEDFCLFFDPKPKRFQASVSPDVQNLKEIDAKRLAMKIQMSLDADSVRINSYRRTYNPVAYAFSALSGRDVSRVVDFDVVKSGVHYTFSCDAAVLGPSLSVGDGSATSNDVNKGNSTCESNPPFYPAVLDIGSRSPNDRHVYGVIVHSIPFDHLSVEVKETAVTLNNRKISGSFPRDPLDDGGSNGASDNAAAK